MCVVHDRYRFGCKSADPVKQSASGSDISIDPNLSLAQLNESDFYYLGHDDQEPDYDPVDYEVSVIIEWDLVLSTITGTLVYIRTNYINLSENNVC